MRHLGYQTIHKPTGRYYIGIHSTDDVNDGYLGSGTALEAAVRKHGRGEFHRHIVKEFPTRAEAADWEVATVTAAVVEDPRSFNLMLGGGAGGGCHPTTREKISKTLKSRTRKVSAKTRRKLSEASKRRKITPEYREKLRRAKLGQKCSEATKARLRVANVGKSLSEETKRKIGESNTGKRRTPEAKRRISKATSKPVEVDGRKFPRQCDAAKFFKVSESVISRWVSKGVNGARRIRWE